MKSNCWPSKAFAVRHRLGLGELNAPLRPMPLFSSPNRRKDAAPAFASFEADAPAEEAATSPSASARRKSRDTGYTDPQVRFDFKKTPGEDMGVVFGFASGCLMPTVVVRAVTQTSRLQGSVFEGDVVLSVNGTLVSDPTKATALLAATSGNVFLSVKASGGNAILQSMPDRTYNYRDYGPPGASSSDE